MYLTVNKEELIKRKAIDTAREIAQQPLTWLKTVQQIKNEKENIARFLDEIGQPGDYDIVFIGAGTSEFVGNSLFPHINKLTHTKARSVASTDMVTAVADYLEKDRPTLLVSFGRSGNSPESVGAVSAGEEYLNHPHQLFITCNANGALAKSVSQLKHAYSIQLTPETNDLSFAMTSSFTNMMLAACLVFDLKHLDTLEKQVSDVVASVTNIVTNQVVDIRSMVKGFPFERIVYLGSNELKGIAQESALKMLELTAGEVVTMYDSPMGFRHGPKSIINDRTLSVILLSDDPFTRRYEMDLVHEISAQRKGNRLLVVTNMTEDNIESYADYVIHLGGAGKLPTILLGLEMITVSQSIAFFRSYDMGITTDNPCPTGEVNRVVTGVTIYKK